MKKQKINVVIPVYNDWDCLELLVRQINQELQDDVVVNIFAINDGSTEEACETKFNEFSNLQIIDLTHNIGHQKAISIGLSYVAANRNCDAVIVMDVDGEDRPGDLKLLIEAFRSEGKIVFARRKKRQENLTFRMFYQIYKLSFKILVGKEIAFGNYCIIPFKSLKKLVHVSDIWNHFSGGVIRSRLLYTSIPLDRGKRYAGHSKMNLISLIIHGISSYTVHLEIVTVRMLLLFSLLFFFSICGILIVISIRVFTDLGIPGWATYSVLGLTMIILQMCFIVLNLSLTVLHYRTQKLFIPAINYTDYIAKKEISLES